MFDIDRWQEIFETIQKNKLRTFLTSISVASGIFILVILLGFGRGMENGIKKEFEKDATNRISVWSRITTKEYKGLNPGRRIQLNNEDYDYITEMHSDEIEYETSVFRIWGATINYKEEVIPYGVEGIHPNLQQIFNQKMVEGRYINYNDIETNSKVIVISNKIKNEVFKNIDLPINEYIKIGGVNFKIVGVYMDLGGDRAENNMYVPFSTAQNIFNGSNRVNNFNFTVETEDDFEKSVELSDKFERDLTTYLKQAHVIAPDDNSAIRVYNAIKDAKRYHTLTSNIAFFFWFVGICTIIAGVVGVSNIMLIIVKERTKEIGIRKALGAKPWAIISMILQESIFITSVAGFGGLILSMSLLEIIGPNVQIEYILNPSVDFTIAITMVFVLIIAGALAGFFPAWKAASIQPVQALSHE